MANFWDEAGSLTFGNEADVEVRLIVPFLTALGYDHDDIRSKYPVVFQEGRRGRKPEADFVVFYGPLQTRATSMLVVEAKAPGEDFEEARSQAESYAFNVRAPLLLITDGVRLEVWQLQPSMESQQVLAVSVAEILSRRGKLEALLSKEAALSHCRSLQHKKVGPAASDFRAYEVAEVKRTNGTPASIGRTLKSLEGRGRFESSTLLVNFYAGAIVGASSGYGKSTLAHDLHRQALAARWMAPDLRLPFEIWLPDLLEDGQSLPSYARERLAAHCPGVTEAAFTDLLREQGAIFVCDSFNRLAAARQNKMEASLRRLIRDFPKIQVFVFTSRGATPDLPLPELSIEGLDTHQQYDLSEIAYPTAPYNPIGFMPAMLRGLAEHPLLLTRVLDHHQRTGSPPTRIVDLFRSWLDRVVDYRASGASAAIEREKALTLLANATLNAPIRTQAAMDLLKDNKIKPSVMDDLIGRDAILVSNSTVELVHESLADYLRAYHISTMGEAEALDRVRALPLDSDSFLPVFLMAILPTRKLQKALWLRLSNVSFATYLKVIRYRADTSSSILKEGANELTEAYLDDFLEGVVLPTEGFFPALKDSVAITISGATFESLAITGVVSTHPASLTYSLHPRAENTKKVNVGKVPLALGRRWINLDESGYRLDSGHLLGIKALRDTLLQILEECLFDGGPVWANERLAGRVRYLTQKFSMPLDGVVELSDLKRHLYPQAHQHVQPNVFRGGPRFTIASMLNDIELLEAHGRSGLDLWWTRLGWSDSTPPGTELLRKLLDEHFRRAQQAYAEVVRTSFGRVASDFGFFPSLPVRFSIAVYEGRRAPWHNVRWSPVASWEAAGADVEFTAYSPLSEGQDHYTQMIDALKGLGRFTQSSRIWSGSGKLPSFDGHSILGGFDGETSVLHQCREWLKEDLEELFRDVPATDSDR